MPRAQVAHLQKKSMPLARRHQRCHRIKKAQNSRWQPKHHSDRFSVELRASNDPPTHPRTRQVPAAASLGSCSRRDQVKMISRVDDNQARALFTRNLYDSAVAKAGGHPSTANMPYNVLIYLYMHYTHMSPPYLW